MEWWAWLVLTFFIFLIVETLVCGFCQYKARYSGVRTSDDPHHVSNAHVNGGPPGTPPASTLVPMKAIPSAVNSPEPQGGGAAGVGAGASSWGLTQPQHIQPGAGGTTATTTLGRNAFIDDIELAPYRPNTEAIGGGQGGLKASGAAAQHHSHHQHSAAGIAGGASPLPRGNTSGNNNGTQQQEPTLLGGVGRGRSVTIKDQDSDDDFEDSPGGRFGGSAAGPGGQGLLPAPPAHSYYPTSQQPTQILAQHGHSPSGQDPVLVVTTNPVAPTATAAPVVTSSGGDAPLAKQTTTTYDGKVLTEDEVMDAL